MLMSVKSNIKPFVKELKKFQNVDRVKALANGADRRYPAVPPAGT